MSYINEKRAIKLIISIFCLAISIVIMFFFIGISKTISQFQSDNTSMGIVVTEIFGEIFSTLILVGIFFLMMKSSIKHYKKLYNSQKISQNESGETLNLEKLDLKQLNIKENDESDINPPTQS